MFLTVIVSCYAMLPASKPLTPRQQAAKDAAEKFQSALIRCENQTKESLADPEGFDPDPQGQWVMLEASENRYVVRFRARAKNALGGMIWGNFECTATYDGSYWSAEIRVL